jgi:hypothetical protein
MKFIIRYLADKNLYFLYLENDSGNQFIVEIDEELEKNLIKQCQEFGFPLDYSGRIGNHRFFYICHKDKDFLQKAVDKIFEPYLIMNLISKVI